MSLRRFCCALVLTVTSLMVPSVTRAGLDGGEHSWRITSPDGRYVLAVISHLPPEEEIQRARGGSDSVEEVQQIRRSFARSGLYRSDGSSEPLWVLQDYWPDYYEAYIAPGGSHVVFVGGQEGFFVGFYASGRRLAWHSDQKLIPCFWSKALFNRYLGRAFMVECAVAGLDSPPSTFTVTTDQREIFVFDVTTGKLLHHRSPWPWFIGAVTVLMPMLIVAIWHRYLLPIRILAIGRATTHVSPDTRSIPTPHVRTNQRLRFTLRWAMGVMTVLCVLLGLAVSFGWRAIVFSPLLLAGLLSWLLARNGRSLWIGLAWGLYGAFLGVVAWALADEAFVQRWVFLRPWLLFGLPLVGILLGGAIGGILERTQRSRRSAIPGGAVARSVVAISPPPPQLN